MSGLVEAVASVYSGFRSKWCFGAAVLDSDYNSVVADTNHETECPLYHGEVYTILQWAALVRLGCSPRDLQQADRLLLRRAIPSQGP